MDVLTTHLPSGIKFEGDPVKLDLEDVKLGVKGKNYGLHLYLRRIRQYSV